MAEAVFDAVVLQNILSFDITNINSLMKTCKSFHRNISKNISTLYNAFEHYNPILQQRIDTHIKRALNVINDEKIINLSFDTEDGSFGYDKNKIKIKFENEPQYTIPASYYFNENPSQIDSLHKLIKLARLYKEAAKHAYHDEYEFDTTKDILANFFNCPSIRQALKLPAIKYTDNKSKFSIAIGSSRFSFLETVVYGFFFYGVCYMWWKIILQGVRGDYGKYWAFGVIMVYFLCWYLFYC